MKKVALTALCALFFCAVCASFGIAADGPKPGTPGSKVPAMVLPEPAGPTHDISKGRDGKGAVCIYFWSVFCSNCKEAMPLLLELNSKWAQKGLTIWAVNVDGDRFSNAVVAFLKDAELPFTVVYDKLEGQYLVAADPLGVAKTPTLIIIDQDGLVRLRQEVVVDLPAVEKTVSELIR